MTVTDQRPEERRAEVDVAGAARPRQPLRWVASLVLLVLAAQLVHLLVTNDNFEWHVVGEYVNASIIGHGIAITLELTVVAMAVGIVGGVLLAVGRLSENGLLRGACGLYVWFFRGIPVLVQLVFWYNLSALLPRISFGVPFGPEFVSGETNHLITPLLAAILGLGLNEAAYMAEIIRFPIRKAVEEDVEEIDLLTAVDAAIRDLREISSRWGEESSRVQAAQCREMLERAFNAAV